jgi:AhpD family alkylhydroperoxidase
MDSMGTAKDSLASIQGDMGKLAKECPEFMKGFKAFHDAVEANGVLDAKTLELVLVGIAVSRQCSYCIHFHVSRAFKAGATKQEILAAAQAAVLMGGGPSLMYLVEQVIPTLEDLG